MTLMAKYRRWWAILLLVALLMPFIGHFTPDLPAPLRTKIAPDQEWWTNASARLDPFINEAFGFRGVLLSGNRAYRRLFHSPQSKLALVGKNQQMYLLTDQNLEQALGVLVDKTAMTNFAALMVNLQALAKSVGGSLVVSSPPAGDTIYFDELPDWAKAQKKSPTNYDLLADMMPTLGVPFADLRKPLMDARRDGPVYRLTDSHWNYRGSLIGYNEIMKAAGHPEMMVSEADSLDPRTPDTPGDLARLIGDPDITGDENYLPKNVNDWRQHVTEIPGMFPESNKHEMFVSYAYKTDHAGPRVLVFGDSFSQFYWPPFLVQKAGAFAWTHHLKCKADLSLVQRFKPDIVIYAPTQRHLGCK